ncbi:MAG: D-glycero-beta-D-manno-heptose-7-phosphate kinase [Candidatus Aminicenantes bacterium]|nr:D-glycero-beta-D-manno-heptose-7-phosphate kinase [Candidatus Aminicenantes bacterium]
MKTNDIHRYREIIKHFKDKKVLVLGDLMLDKYIWGKVSRISPEAPVPVVEVENDTSALGGAGNVGHNVQSLGAVSLLVGVVGMDFQGEWIVEHTHDSRGIFFDDKRPTTVKTRILAHQQQVVRVDHEKKMPISSQLEDKILRFIQQESCDGLIISDYNKGLLKKSLMAKLLKYTESADLPVFVDPKVENFSQYSPVTLLTPNHLEAEKIVHHHCFTSEEVEKAGRKILSKISADHLIIKRGEQGMTVFEKKNHIFHIPAKAKEVYDVTGAGDTVIATAALGLLTGASLREAAFLANIAAGIVVGKIGTASLTSEELLSAL